MPEETGSAVSFIRACLAARRFILRHARRSASLEDCAQAGWVAFTGAPWSAKQEQRVRRVMNAHASAEKGTTT